MQLSDSQQWLLLAGLVLLGWLVYLLAPILTPFAVAAALAYLGDPLVDRLENWKLSRTIAVVVVFLVMSLLLVVAILIAVPLLERQIEGLVERLPRYLSWLRETALPWVEQRVGLDTDTLALERLVNLVLDNWQQAGGIAAAVGQHLTKSGLALVGLVVNLTLIPVVTFYLLRDWDRLIAAIDDMIPRKYKREVSRLARQSDSVLGAFLRGQLLVMLGLGLIYAIGLSILGLEFGFLIGIIAGLLSFVPYLGTIVGVLIAVIVAVVQFQDILHPALVLGVFGIGQALEGSVLTPWLVGDKIGLHPVAVIFAVMAGGQLFGFLGILLALPVAAVLMVLIREAYSRYKGSRMYEPDAVRIEQD